MQSELINVTISGQLYEIYKDVYNKHIEEKIKNLSSDDDEMLEDRNKVINSLRDENRILKLGIRNLELGQKAEELLSNSLTSKIAYERIERENEILKKKLESLENESNASIFAENSRLNYDNERLKTLLNEIRITSIHVEQRLCANIERLNKENKNLLGRLSVIRTSEASQSIENRLNRKDRLYSELKNDIHNRMKSLLEWIRLNNHLSFEMGVFESIESMVEYYTKNIDKSLFLSDSTKDNINNTRQQERYNVGELLSIEFELALFLDYLKDANVINEEKFALKTSEQRVDFYLKMIRNKANNE